MLARIEIKDFALIEEIQVDFEAGLSILSGETGAGKSIIVDALACFLEARANRDLIRHGAEALEVTAQFQLGENQEAEALLADFGIEAGDEIILYREIRRDLKHSSRINQKLVSQSSLRSLAAKLFEIHGQGEQQLIFSEKTHQELLDRYLGQELLVLKEQWQKHLTERKASLKKLDSLGQSPSERLRRLDVLAFQIGEIEEVDPQDQELEELEKEVKKLRLVKKIRDDLAQSLAIIEADDEQNLLSRLNQASFYLDFAAKHSQKIKDYQITLEEKLEELEDLRDKLSLSYERLESRDEEIDEMEERIDDLHRLFSKYGGSAKKTKDFLDQAKEQYLLLDQGQAAFEAETKLLEATEKQLDSLAKKMTRLRSLGGKDLEAKIMQSLADLEMPDSRFEIAVNLAEADSQNYYHLEGRNLIEFRMSANPGEPLMPLVKIASGGEASRVLLAIKSILAACDHLDLLIFDEIDTGISGQSSIQVAKKLEQVAQTRQVLCVTHTAQIAAKAKNHYFIQKEAKNERTITRIKKLDQAERVSEIARLLSGEVTDEQSLNLAKRLLNA